MKNKINFDILESLRGMAALYVCIGHSRGVLWIGGEQYLKVHPRETLGIYDYLILCLNMLTRLSTEFVIVFFVLSGFSIAHSLRSNKEAIPFYKRRFVRLYPPYITAILWGMAVVLLVGSIYPQFIDGTYRTTAFDRLHDSYSLLTWPVFLQHLFYVHMPGSILHPFWSLSMEVVFYLLAPFLFRKKNIYYPVSIMMFVLSMISLNTQWKLPHFIENYFYFSIFFAIGVGLYDHYDWVVSRFRFLSGRWSPALAGIVFLTMVAVSLTGMSTLNAFLASFMCILLIAYLLRFNREIKWLIGIGRFSYTLYITHFPSVFLYMTLFFLVTAATPPDITNPLAFLPCIPFALGIAYLFYLLAEKRTKTVLDKLRKEKRHRTSGISVELAQTSAIVHKAGKN